MITATQLTYLFVSITSFLLGVIVGWGLAHRRESVTQPALRRIIAVVILATYTVSVLAEISVDGYATPLLLHGIMGGIVGYLFSQGSDFVIDIGGN